VEDTAKNVQGGVMKSWIVRAQCTVIKDFVISASTEEKARARFEVLEGVESESENEMTDWELLDIEENK